MEPINYVVHLLLSIVLIIGGYQFYFWCQRHVFFEPKELRLPIDDHIPFRPNWVWIYSFLYYPAILYVNIVLESSQQFVLVVTSYLVLLGIHMAFFSAFPVRTPASWRDINLRRTLSERFLAYLQTFDDATNSFPSMHASVAMLTAMHLYSDLNMIALTYPLLVSISCLYTKQHYVIDVIAGVLLGWCVYELYTGVLL